MPATPVELIGRPTSHFSRVAMMFAHEVDVPFTLVRVDDLLTLDPVVYAGNPAMKVPALRIGSSVLFGTENICRRLAEHAGRADDVRIVWPERATSDVLRCAQELTWHAMAAQVTLILGLKLGKLPPDNIFFVKVRKGLESSLSWLAEHLAQALDDLPRDRALSLFEVTLFCLVEHLGFRRTLDDDPPPALRQFAAEFGARESARKTPF
jgi:glutathione S-transferase